jgi:hypothetical protein
MKVNRRFLNWGVFLLAAGGVMLVAQGNAVNNETVAQALRLWPIAVIAVGVGLLLRRTRLGLPAGMLAAAMPGLLLGGLVVAAPQMVPGCSGVEPASFETRQGTFGGAASVDLRFACGELSVTTVPGNGWRLEAGDGSGAAAAVDASADRLTVASSDRDHPFRFTRRGDDWRLSLPTAGTLDLDTEIDAGRGQFDLAGARLGSLRLAVNAGEARVALDQATVAQLSMSVNAASASVRLPATGNLSADFSVNAGSLRICAPSEVGLRIHQDGVLSTTSYPGLVRSGDTWESPGYSIAINHADVTISVNVGSVDVNPMGGCQ